GSVTAWRVSTRKATGRDLRQTLKRKTKRMQVMEKIAATRGKARCSAAWPTFFVFLEPFVVGFGYALTSDRARTRSPRRRVQRIKKKMQVMEKIAATRGKVRCSRA